MWICRRGNKGARHGERKRQETDELQNGRRCQHQCRSFVFVSLLRRVTMVSILFVCLLCVFLCRWSVRVKLNLVVYFMQNIIYHHIYGHQMQKKMKIVSQIASTCIYPRCIYHWLCLYCVLCLMSSCASVIRCVCPSSSFSISGWWRFPTIFNRLWTYW